MLYSKDFELCCVPTVPLLWSLCSRAGTGFVSVQVHRLRQVWAVGNLTKGEAGLIVTLLSEESCPDPRGQVDLRSKKIDLEKYF